MRSKPKGEIWECTWGI